MARCDPLPILNTPQGLWDHSMNFRMTTLEFYLNPILGLVPWDFYNPLGAFENLNNSGI